MAAKVPKSSKYADQKRHVHANTKSAARLRSESQPKMRGRKPAVVAQAGPTKKQIQDTLKKLERLNKGNNKKAQKLVKDVFADVFSDLQLTDQFSLKVFAMKNPALFYTLAAKLIPIQVSGEGGGPIVTETVFR